MWFRFVALAVLLLAGTAHAEEAFVTNQNGDSLTVVDLGTLKAVATIPVGGKPAGIAVSRDGRRAFVTSPDSRTLAVIDTATRAIVRRIEVGDGPRAFGAFIRR